MKIIRMTLCLLLAVILSAHLLGVTAADNDNSCRRVYFKSQLGLNGVITDGKGMTAGIIENSALISSRDDRIGYITSDDGSYFCLPFDKEYRFRLTADAETMLSVGIEEYDASSDKTTFVLGETMTVYEDFTAKVTLPAAGEEFSVPTDLEYYVGINNTKLIGDADTDGIVTITDATTVQRYEAEIVTLSKTALRLSDVDKDGFVTVTDSVFIQRSLVEFDVPYSIGFPE